MSTMNKMIEYMAFGRPIVAFDLVEHRRTAESAAVSAAVYVKGNDDAALGRAIRELLLNAELRQSMSAFARARFRKDLAWENSEKHLIATYRNLLLHESQSLRTAPSQHGRAPLERAGD